MIDLQSIGGLNQLGLLLLLDVGLRRWTATSLLIKRVEMAVIQGDKGLSCRSVVVHHGVVQSVWGVFVFASLLFLLVFGPVNCQSFCQHFHV